MIKILLSGVYRCLERLKLPCMHESRLLGRVNAGKRFGMRQVYHLRWALVACLCLAFPNQAKHMG